MKLAIQLFLLAILWIGSFELGRWSSRLSCQPETSWVPVSGTYDLGVATSRWPDKIDLTSGKWRNIYHENWQYVDGKMVMLSPIVVVPFKEKTQ